MTQNPGSPRKPQARAVEAVDSSARVPRRKRVAEVHRGIHAVLDTAVEARRDTEEIAREYELRRPDVQDLFAVNTRREVRKLQTEVRELRAELKRAA